MNQKNRVCLLLATFASMAATAAPYDIPAPVESTAKAQITAATLEAPIRFLASDALEGRGPATRGDELARVYLSSQLQAMGYSPGGPQGQWQQLFDIVGMKAEAPARWTFDAKGKSVELKLREDF